MPTIVFPDKHSQATLEQACTNWRHQLRNSTLRGMQTGNVTGWYQFVCLLRSIWRKNRIGLTSEDSQCPKRVGEGETETETDKMVNLLLSKT